MIYFLVDEEGSILDYEYDLSKKEIRKHNRENKTKWKTSRRVVEDYEQQKRDTEF